MLFSLFSSLILVLALSVDAFVASFAYGADQIEIPKSSLAVICGICSGTLGISLLLGNVVKPFFPPGLTHILSFAILFLLGVVKLFDSALKSFIKRHQSRQKKLHFHLAGIRFILQVYVDSTAADQDLSRKLSPGEAASLSIALSLDGLCVGFGAGLSQTNAVAAILFSLLATGAAVLVGALLGKKVAKKLDYDLSWLSGLLLILLAFLR